MSTLGQKKWLGLTCEAAWVVRIPCVNSKDEPHKCLQVESFLLKPRVSIHALYQCMCSKKIGNEALIGVRHTTQGEIVHLHDQN